MEVRQPQTGQQVGGRAGVGRDDHGLRADPPVGGGLHAVGRDRGDPHSGADRTGGQGGGQRGRHGRDPAGGQTEPAARVTAEHQVGDSAAGTERGVAEQCAEQGPQQSVDGARGEAPVAEGPGGGGLRPGLQSCGRGVGEAVEPAAEPRPVQRTAQWHPGGGLPGGGQLRVPDPVPAPAVVHEYARRERARIEAVEVEHAARLGEGGVQQMAAVVEPEAVEFVGGRSTSDPFRGLQDLNGEAVGGEYAGGGEAREAGSHHDDVRVGLSAGAAGEVVRGHWWLPPWSRDFGPVQAAGCWDTVRPV